MTLLNVENLNINFWVAKKELNIVQNLSFEVNYGEILAIVGESGCGKSISCMALTKLLPEPPAKIKAKSILFNGEELTSLNSRKMRKIRGGGIAYIFQEPSASLNPVFKVGAQIAEAIMLHRKDVCNIKEEVINLLEKVGIPDPHSRINAYPHELSGGMQQRIMIAMALAGHPQLLIADEPTTALDVTIQAQILELIDKTRRDNNMGVILITHNLGIVSEVADRVAVMYAGQLVESASTSQIINNPTHPYTKALLAAVPKQGNSNQKLNTITGTVPSPENFAKGCRFWGRCEVAPTLDTATQERCKNCTPCAEEVNSTHKCFCHALTKKELNS